MGNRGGESLPPTELAVTEEEERREDSHKKCVSPERGGVHEVSV
jgi:hypothetical protein